MFTLLLVAGSFWLRWQWGRVHQHCIKGTGTMLQIYAGEHEGNFPSHTNGFLDAMLLLVPKDNPDEVRYITGPGDDGAVLSNALVQQTHVPDTLCSRVYIQGLSVFNSPEIALLFDRYSCEGGDHLRGHGPRLREVCNLDGSMQKVLDKDWPEYSSKQVQLLISNGIPDKLARYYYALTRQ
jgi:hypothetical protein